MRYLVLLVLIATLTACSSAQSNDEDTVETPEDTSDTSITEADLSVCSTDEDCIVVDYSHCCGATKRAINATHLEAYNTHPEWQKFDDPDECAVIGQCLDDSQVTEALCSSNRCQLVFP